MNNRQRKGTFGGGEHANWRLGRWARGVYPQGLSVAIVTVDEIDG